MQKIGLRQMMIQDCPEVSRIVCEAFAWGGRREDLSAEEIGSYIHGRGSEEAIRDQRNDYLFWVATVGERICGTVAIEENEIAKLYVAPTFHGRGIGRALFELAESIVARNGHVELTAWVAFDSAIPFYEAMGMSAVGRKFDLLGKSDGRNTMLMRKSLSSGSGNRLKASPGASRQ